jgi:hypothetical protein
VSPRFALLTNHHRAVLCCAVLPPQVDRLTVKTEQYECDVEEMTAGLKKKAKPPPKLVQVGGM